MRYSLITVLLCIMFLSPLSAEARPAVFSALTFSQAQQQAKALNKLLLIDFTATWCGPCHRMDETTWSNLRVEKWVHDNAIAVQVDVDEDENLASRFKVSAMPTLVVFRPPDLSNGFDRHTGAMNPDDLLTWLFQIQHGMSSMEALWREFAAVQGKGGESEIKVRSKYADALMEAGEYAAATKQYVWLWNNIEKEDPAMGGVRVSFMASDMGHLAGHYRPAWKQFAALRDQCQSTDRKDWIVLNEVLGQNDKTIAWFDSQKGDPANLQSLRKIGYRLQKLLIDHDRWADAALFYADPLAELTEDYKRALEVKKITKDYDPFPGNAAQMYVSLLAAGRDREAKQVAHESLKLENTGEMRGQLARTAIDAHQPRVEQLFWILGDTNLLEQILSEYWAILLSILVVVVVGCVPRTRPALPVAIILAVITCSNYLPRPAQNIIGITLTTLFVIHIAGYCFLIQGHPKLALHLYRAYCAICPWRSTAYPNVVAAYIILCRYNDAIDLCDKVLSVDAKPLNMLTLRALCRLHINEIDRAHADWQLALQNPASAKSPVVHFLSGSIHLREGAYDQSIAAFNRALELSPNVAEFLISRANVYCVAGQFDNCSADLTKLASVPLSRYAKAYLLSNQARLQLRTGKLTEALQNATDATKVYPNHSPILATLGVALMRNGRHQDALIPLSQVIEKDPYFAEAFWFRHEVYEALAKTDLAEADKKVAMDFGYRPYL